MDIGTLVFAVVVIVFIRMRLQHRKIAIGRKKFLESNFPEAIKYFTQGINEKYVVMGVKPHAYLSRAAVLSAMEDYEGALADCEKCLELKPGDATGLAVKGMVECRLGKYDDAIKDCDAAILKAPMSSIVYVCRGTVHTSMNEFESALKNFDVSLKMVPKSQTAYVHRAACLLRMRNFEETIKECTEALKILPKSSQINLIRACAYIQLNEFDKALADLMVAEKTFSSQPSGAAAKTRMLLGRGQVDQADEFLDSFLGNYSKNTSELSYLRGRIKMLKAPQEAQSHLDEALKLDPYNLEALYAKGENLEQLGSAAEGAAIKEKAIEEGFVI